MKKITNLYFFLTSNKKHNKSKWEKMSKMVISKSELSENLILLPNNYSMLYGELMFSPDHDQKSNSHPDFKGCTHKR